MDRLGKRIYVPEKNVSKTTQMFLPRILGLEATD